MHRIRLGSATAAAVLACILPGTAGAAITPTRTASDIAGAISDGANAPTVLAASFVTIPPNGNPAAVADSALTSFPTTGGRYGLLTTGDANLADDPNATANNGFNAGGFAVRGTSDRDVTILKVDVSVPSSANCISVDFRFLSEEFPEFVGKTVNDAFVAELDSSTWTTTASVVTAPNNFAFDPTGNVVSINSTGVTSVSAVNSTGTTYDAATTLLRASAPTTPGNHSLYLSIFDQGDNVLDSAVFIDRLTVTKTAAGACKPGAGSANATPAASDVIKLPSNKKCASRRKFRIRIRQPGGVQIQTALVFLNGKKLRMLTRKVFQRKRKVAGVNLRGLPKGTFKVRIVVLTTEGTTLRGTRTYRTCAKKRKSQRPPRL
ncbi:MAG: choice-of-anchor L domain-containing protein [Mycobacteriales bacterium]